MTFKGYRSTISAGSTTTKYKEIGANLFVSGGGNGGYTSNTKVVASVQKTRQTVLLGIATTAAAAGGTVSVATKGIFTTTWNSNPGTYDQSGNNPVGNKGSVAGSVLTCLGLGI